MRHSGGEHEEVLGIVCTAGWGRQLYSGVTHYGGAGNHTGGSADTQRQEKSESHNKH